MLPRRLRRSIATAGAVVALLALPSTALAAPDFQTSSSLTSSGPYVSGDVATYTLTLVNDGTAPVGASTLTILDVNSYDPVTIVGTPTVIDGPTPGSFSAGDVTVAANSPTIGVNTSFAANEDVRITFQVRLPERYEEMWIVGVEGDIDGDYVAVSDSDRIVSKGGPSSLNAIVARSPRSAAVGSTYTGSVAVKNSGAGAAYFARIALYADGDPSEFSPWWGANPAFAPQLAITGGCDSVAGSTCVLGTVASGTTRTITYTVSSLTHLGNVYVSGFGSAADVDSSSFDADGATVSVTDGTRTAARVAVEGPRVGTAGADLTYRGEVVNAGPDAIKDALLQIDTSVAYGAPDVESIRSITLGNGAPCSPRLDRYHPPYTTPLKNAWQCPVAALASGQRLTFTVVANFASTRANDDAWVNARIVTRGEPARSGIEGTAYTSLNPTATVDLQVSTSGAAQIGVGRVAPLTVTIRNAGTATADTVTLNGDVRGVEGTFDLASMPSNCTGSTKPQEVRCELDPIAPGATTTFTLKVRAGSKLGSLAVRAATDWTSDARGVAEANPDDDSQVAVLDVVKADAVVLGGVTVSKPVGSTLGKLVKNGVKSTVACPTSCRVTGALTVPRPLALRLGLVKGGKGGRAGSATVTLGTATSSRTAAGSVVVTIKLTKAFRTKVGSLGSALTVTRTLTVVSTDPDTKDATFRTTGTVRFRPGR